ncbi:MAG: MarR family transcriptional regulator [Saprospiraceae bacterium]|nr:MarR family transcriptional regulator [Saprospiraceae bacterium]
MRQNILSAASMVRENIRHFIQPYGLTPKQLEILQILRLKDEEKEGLTILEIRDAMNDNRPDTSRLVTRLKEKKLVDRKNCKQDKRYTRVHISPLGQHLLTEIDSRLADLHQLAQHLSTDELSELNRLLKKLQGQLDAGSAG